MIKASDLKEIHGSHITKILDEIEKKLIAETQNGYTTYAYTMPKDLSEKQIDSLISRLEDYGYEVRRYEQEDTIVIDW
jgi:hypothetical protein